MEFYCERNKLREERRDQLEKMKKCFEFVELETTTENLAGDIKSAATQATRSQGRCRS